MPVALMAVAVVIDIARGSGFGLRAELNRVRGLRRRWFGFGRRLILGREHTRCCIRLGNRVERHEWNFPPAEHIGRTRKSYNSDAGSFLCFGLRSLFGLITLLAFTVPTRSRAIARTSFSARNGLGFLAMQI